MLKIETELYRDAKITGRTEAQGDPKSKSLADIVRLVDEYNDRLTSDKWSGMWREAAAEVLDEIMCTVGMWLTEKNPRKSTISTGRDTRTKRWAALTDLVQQCGVERRKVRSLMLTGPTDFKKVSDNGRSYWLERLDPKHRPGWQLSSQYATWLQLGRVSFWVWLADREYLVRGKKYKVSAMEGVEYVTPTERRQYEIKFRGDLIYDADGKLFDTKEHSTAFSGTGWAIFVCSQKTRQVYAGSHTEGRFHHSSFLAGQNVVAAGELLVEKGKLRVLTGKSGHYKPDPEDMQNFLKGIPITRAGAIILPDTRQSQPDVYSVRAFREQGTNAPTLSWSQARRNVPKWGRKVAWLADDWD